MSSFDKFGFGTNESSQQQQASNSYSSRPSNTLARLAFNIYDSAGGNNSGSTNSSSASIRGSPGYASRQQSPTPPPPASPVGSSRRSTPPGGFVTKKKYKASYELTSFSLLHNDMQELTVISGKNSLQILDIGRGKIVNDLLSANYAMKNKKVIGSILDVSTGYNYNSKFVATSTTTGSILIFNAQSSNKTNKLVYKLSDHSRAVNSVDFSQLDQNLLMSGSQDGQMKLWDLRSNSGKPTITMYGNADAVRCLKFSPFNSKKFVSIFDSGVIQKWDIRQFSQFEKKFNAHTGPGLTLDWNLEVDYIVSGGRDKQLQVWNMNSNDTRQIPDHVIYTSSPISKVCFRPKSDLTSIGNAEVATSFLNNDLGQAQIYSLRRKYIPLFSIENHTAQITGLSFQNESTLLTCSKDKYFVVDDLANYRHTVENLSVASTTWSPDNNLLYVNQSAENHILLEEFDQPFSSYSPQPQPHSQQQQPSPVQNNFNSNVSTSPNYMTNASPTPMNKSSSVIMSPGFSMTSTNNIHEYPFQQISRPGISRTTTQLRRPTLDRDHSHGSDPSSSRFQSQYHLPTHQPYQKQFYDNMSVMNPFAIPVDLPINNSKDILKYLTSNYIVDPAENPLVDTCDLNSDIAYSVGNFRDAQTWKVIKQGLIWESSLEQQLNYTNTEVQSFEPHTEDNESFRSHSTHENGQNPHYSTSNSTNFGKTPSLSDLSEFNNSSLNSNAKMLSNASSFKMTGFKQSYLKHNSSDGAVDNIIEEDENSEQKENIIDDTINWGVEPSKQTTPHPDIKEENEEAVEFTESKSMPIVNMKRVRPSSSLAGRSISPTFSVDSLGSSNSQSLFRPLMHRNNFQVSPLLSSSPGSLAQGLSSQRGLPATQFNALKVKKSNISELTRQLTNNLDLNSDSLPLIQDYKIPPYAPNQLIRNALNFSLDQGDLIMSCTLLLLFNGKYKIYGNERFKEVIFNYLTFLQRLRFFIQFTKISIVLNENKEFKTLDIDLSLVSKTSSSIRYFCSNCGKLITNEETKAKMLKEESLKKDKTGQVIGTWFCESCSTRNKCVYCNEILKKLSLVKLECGHNGHFGCLKHWFVELEMEECPAGCL